MFGVFFFLVNQGVTSSTLLAIDHLLTCRWRHASAEGPSVYPSWHTYHTTLWPKQCLTSAPMVGYWCAHAYAYDTDTDA